MKKYNSRSSHGRHINRVYVNACRVKTLYYFLNTRKQIEHINDNNISYDDLDQIILSKEKQFVNEAFNDTVILYCSFAFGMLNVILSIHVW